MPFLAINFGNNFDPENQTPYLTRAQADARAERVMDEFPKAKVIVVEVLAEYQAEVKVSSKPPVMPDPEPTPAE